MKQKNKMATGYFIICLCLLVGSLSGWLLSPDPAAWVAAFSQYLFWLGLGTGAFLFVSVLRVTRAEWRRPIARPGLFLLAGAGGLVVLLPLLNLLRLQFLRTLPEKPAGLWPALVPGQSFLVQGAVVILFLCSAGLLIVTDLVLDQSPPDRDGSLLSSLLDRLYAWKSSPVSRRFLRHSLKPVTVLFCVSSFLLLTVTGWHYGMNLIPHWNSTIYAAYFVMTALQSGAAGLMLFALWGDRQAEEDALVTPHHISQYGKFMIAFALFWFYFRFAEYLTVWYGSKPHETDLLAAHTWGAYPVLFFLSFGLNFLVPLLYFSFPRLRKWRPGVVAVSIGVLLGTAVEKLQMYAPLHVNGKPVLQTGTVLLGLLQGLAFPALMGIVIWVLTRWYSLFSSWELADRKLIRGRRTIGGRTFRTHLLVAPEDLSVHDSEKVKE